MRMMAFFFLKSLAGVHSIGCEANLEDGSVAKWGK